MTSNISLVIELAYFRFVSNVILFYSLNYCVFGYFPLRYNLSTMSIKIPHLLPVLSMAVRHHSLYHSSHVSWGKIERLRNVSWKNMETLWNTVGTCIGDMQNTSVYIDLSDSRVKKNSVLKCPGPRLLLHAVVNNRRFA